MQIRVLYFASLREMLGRDEERIEIGHGGTVADLLSVLERRADWKDAVSRITSLRIAVDQEFADEGAALEQGSEVAFFPPVTGG